MGKEEGTILQLADQVQEMNAGEGHAILHQMKQTEGLTGVISVYDQVKPSNIILDELEQWAEETNNEEVLKKITELANDMNFQD